MLPPITLGRFASESRTPRESPYRSSAPPSPFAYTEIVADAQDIAASYAAAELDLIGQSAGGRDQYAMRIADDGTKPILLVAQGIHGPEIDYAPAVGYWLRRVCDQDTPEDRTFLRTFALYVIVTVNPDGMAQDSRRNDNGIDLNRNWPQYWEAFPSPTSEKGPAPFSEPETQNIRDWYAANNAEGRLVSTIDLHGWESRDEWGWICEQHFYSAQAEWLQRGGFLHYRHLARARDWSAYTWTDADPRYPNEYRSNYKPYLYTYARHLSQNIGLGALWEYPVGENKAVICTVALDVLDGLMLATIDAQRPNVSAELIGPEATVINDHPYFDTWEADFQRPTYYRASNLQLSYRDRSAGDGIYGQRAIELYRPSGLPWGYAAHAFGYAQTENYRLSVGGEQPSGANSNDVHQERNDAVRGTTAFGHFPQDTEWGAACGAPGDTIYAAGGYGDTGYNVTVWRLRTGNALYANTWQAVATLPAGTQRHAMAYAVGHIYVIGGRLSDGYTAQMLEIDPNSGSVTDVGPLPQGPRGYVTAIARGDRIYIFGGYNPSAGIVADACYYDTSTGTFTMLVNEYEVEVEKEVTLEDGTTETIIVTETRTEPLMPAPRRKMAACLDESSGDIYLWGGDDDNYNAIDTVWRFDTSHTFTELSLDLLVIGGDGEESATTIDPPVRCAGGMFFVPDRNELLLVGGEDDAGNRYGDVFVVELDEDNFTYRRGYDDVYAYGWFRSNNVITGSAGDRFALTAAIKADTDYPLDRVPYVRLTVYTSGSGGLADIRRKVRQWYTVPPKDKYGIFTVPIVLYDDEEQVRAYIRLYGNDQRILVGAFQITKTATSYPELLPPGQTWRPESAPRVFYANHFPLRFSGPYPAFSLYGYFSPLWGANLDDYVTVLTFIPSGETGEPITGARLLFDSRLPANLSPYLNVGFDYYFQNPDYATWVLEVDFPDGSTEQRTAPAGKLNFTRVSRSWRRDTIGWTLTYRGGELVLALAWTSGEIELAIPVPGGVGGLIGWQYEPSGVLVPAARGDRPYTQWAPVATIGSETRSGDAVTSALQSLVTLQGRAVAVPGAGLSNGASVAESAAPFVRINGDPVAHGGSLTDQLDSMDGGKVIPRRGVHIFRNL